MTDETVAALQPAVLTTMPCPTGLGAPEEKSLETFTEDPTWNGGFMLSSFKIAGFLWSLGTRNFGISPLNLSEFPVLKTRDKHERLIF